MSRFFPGLANPRIFQASSGVGLGPVRFVMLALPKGKIMVLRPQHWFLALSCLVTLTPGLFAGVLL
ncbi:MAG: hypothetical protein ACKO9Q_09480, partial [Pirellula sp.]